MRKFGLILTLAGLMWGAALVMFFPVSAQLTTDPTCKQEIGTWQLATSAPDNHIEGASAVIDGKLYAITGFANYSDTLYPSNKVTAYDPLTDTWETRTTPTPIEASHIQGTADGRYIWVAGGFIGPHPGSATTQVWRYDTVADTWQAGPPLPERRASGGVVRLGRTLHYISGLHADRQTDADDHYMLNLDDPNASWQRIGTFPRPRNHFQAVALEGKIYAVGGQFGHDGAHQDVPLLDVYDPATNTWSPLADLPETRSHAEMGTFVVNERIMIVGGRRNQNGEQPVNTVLEYNPQSDTWAQIATLPEGLISPMANIVGEMLVVTAGGTNWRSPQSQTWVAPVIDNCARAMPTNVQSEGALNTGTVRPDFTFERPTNRDGSPGPGEWYNLQIQNDNGDLLLNEWYSDGAVCQSDPCRVQLTIQQFPAGLVNGTYTARVRAWADNVLSDFSAPYTFTVSVPVPTPPTGLNINTGSGSPVIYLPADPNATWAQVYISGVNHRQWYPLDNCPDACEIAPSVYPTNGTYSVYIQKWGAGGYSGGSADAWSGPYDFTLDFPTPATPANLAGTTAQVSWAASDGATWYQVWVGTADFSTTTFYEWRSAASLGCETTCTLAVANTGGVVWVRGWGPGGMSPWANAAIN